MSTDVGRAPLTDEQWARDMAARVRSLEQSSVARIGSWTLVDIDGQLLAVKPGAEISLDGSPIRDDVSATLRGYATGVDLSLTNQSVQTARDNQVQGWSGDLTAAESPDAAVLTTVSEVYSMILRNTSDIAEINAALTAQGAKGGALLSVRYADYPDGPLPPALSVTYSGLGVSTVDIVGGIAKWTVADQLNRDATIIYTAAPTDTDMQVVRATVTTPPQRVGATTAKYWLIGRSNIAGTRFVFARIYKTSPYYVTYSMDIGYMVDGVETLVKTLSALHWSPDYYLRCGVGTTPRAFQLWLGARLVWEFTDVGAVSMLGAAYRHWGDRREVRYSAPYAANSGGTSVNSAYDDAPPTLVAPAARMYRTSAAGVNLPAGVVVLANNFFGYVDHFSTDITPDLTSGSFTVTRQGSYGIHARTKTSGSTQLGLMVNGVTVLHGGAASSSAPTGHWSVPLAAGDTVQLCSVDSSAGTAVGEPTGTQTYFSITAEALSFL